MREYIYVWWGLPCIGGTKMWGYSWWCQWWYDDGKDIEYDNYEDVNYNDDNDYDNDDGDK